MPSWKELKRFCERDGWELYKNTDHYFFRKVMPDGAVKRTKVSMGTGEIKPSLWREILKKQLLVSQEYFNKHC
ncbi:type II toxin-antitoxin system HicA family toxin [Heliorestis convoluta]|uniref:YcfA family protein, putative n=1 Tax=Heliorestis convoluta TaxID=356322 RepID=A0A5Q2MWT5_9FIRM|nr:type II toxin-antitoxin system HicA family toxin [Heliorestis convoluta]QGG46857.1 YcfA family protein, putative [Heliorestis convoluta]